MSFEVVFAVPMECESCVESVYSALRPVEGVKNIDIDLDNNLVTTTGSSPPSEIVKAIQATGRDAIIRGTGKANSAAVCILESFDPKDSSQPVKGLARIVSVGPDSLYIDLTVNGLPKGQYYPSIRTSGNLLEGALSTGALFYKLDPVSIDVPSDKTTAIALIGALAGTGLFSGQSFLRADLAIDQLIGRSVILSRLKDEIALDSLCGVIARSAGAWENDKQVCSCTGKTVWQERTDAVQKGLTV